MSMSIKGKCRLWFRLWLNRLKGYGRLATLNMLWFSVANLHFSKKKCTMFFSHPSYFHILSTYG